MKTQIVTLQVKTKLQKPTLKKKTITKIYFTLQVED